MIRIIFTIILLAISGQVFAQSSTISDLPNGGAMQQGDAIPISRCSGTSGCNFKILGGKLAISASSPLVLNATTGNMSCPTCSTGGGGSPGGSTNFIQYNAGGGNFGGISPSTSGFVLTSNGISSVPSFQSAGSFSVTASGTITALTLAQQTALTVDAQQFGALQDGSTDDTAALNAALLAVSTAVGQNGQMGWVRLHGQSEVCGLIYYRNSGIKFEGGRLQVKSGCSTSPPIISENYATNKASSQANICGISSLVPSWFGNMNAKIDCNKAGASYTGECIGFYGPSEIWLGVNQIVNAKNASYPTLEMIDGNGGNSHNNPQCQEESHIDKMIINDSGGQGLWNFTHDADMNEFTAGFNADCSFNGGGFDHIGYMHTYAEGNGCGQVFTGGMQIDNDMTDGDYISIGSTASNPIHISQLWQYNVGYNGYVTETYGLSNQSTSALTIDSVTCTPYVSATNAACIINGTASSGLANNTVIRGFQTNGLSATGMKGIVNYSSGNTFTDFQIGGFIGTGGVGFEEHGANNKISGVTDDNTVSFAIASGAASGDEVNLVTFAASGLPSQTAYTGAISNLMHFNLNCQGGGTNCSQFDSHPAGTASAPSLNFAGDLLTGLFSPATAQLAVAVNGVQDITITSGGVGIGTTSPTSNLDVVGIGTSGGPSITIENITGNTTANAYGPVLSLNNHVSGKNAFYLTQFQNSTSDFAIANANSPFQKWLGIDQSGNITDCCGFLQLPQLEINNNVLSESVTNGVAEVAINYSGYLGGTTQYRNTGIYNGKNGTVAEFIGSTGFVGIGTAAPGYVIDVWEAGNAQARFNSTGASGSQVLINDAAGSQQSVINFGDAGSVKWQVGKQTDNSFFVYDSVTGSNAIQMATGSAIGLNRNVVVNGSSAASGAALTIYGISSMPYGQMIGCASTHIPVMTMAFINSQDTLELGPCGTNANDTNPVLYMDGAATSGRIMIGTSVPFAGAALTTNGQGYMSNGFLVAAGSVGIGTTSPVVSLDDSKNTDAIILPVGTTGQRPASPVNGMIRYNSTATATVEGYVNGAWASLGAGGGGGATFGYTTTTFSSTPTFSCTHTGGDSFLITLTGNVTSSTLSGCTTGQVITFRIVQDATGGRSFVWPTNVLGVPTISSTLNSTASTALNITGIYDGTNFNATSVGSCSGSSCPPFTFAGSSSGQTILQASATASGTLTLPAATDTLVGKATTDTLTNKTFDTAGTGNAFKINGTAISAVTGTGSVVLGTTPTFTTSAIDPLLIGGSAGNDSLTLESTSSGTHTTDFIAFLTGAQAEAARITSAGLLGIGTTTPLSSLDDHLNGALSTGNGPALAITGTWITGGSATTNKPQVLIEPKGTSSSAWSTAGTGLGINSVSGFTGNLIDAQLVGVSKFSVGSTGATTVNGLTSGGNITLSSGGPFVLASNGPIAIESAVSLSTAEAGRIRIGGTQNYTYTTGADSSLALNDNYTPASGTGTFVGLSVNNTINFTAGTGITRGIFVNPTLTSVADYRFLDVRGIVVNLVGNPVVSAQTASLFNIPTYTATTASQTITTASTVDIKGAPVASTNITITNPYALNVEAGNSNFGGHVQLAGGTPVVSSCGGGTLASGSSDNKGQITGISAATACTLTFATALPSAPACIPTSSTGIAVGASTTTSAMTTTMALFTGTLYYICF